MDLSASMLYDTKFRNAYHRAIKPRTIKKWVDDSRTTQCYECTNPFGLFRRRHHCRFCGRIYCGNCCFERCVIPKQLIDTLPTGFKREEEYQTRKKLCTPCAKYIHHYNSLNKLPEIFFLLPLDIYDMKRISMVCRSWNSGANIVLSAFRDIQYSTNELTPLQKQLLYNNRRILYRHNNWSYQMAKCGVNCRNERYVSRNRHECSVLMCSRECSLAWTIPQCIDILQRRNTEENKKKALLDIKRVQEVEFIGYLPAICFTAIHYEDTLFYQVVIPRCVESRYTCHQVFWELQYKNGTHVVAYKEALMQSISRELSDEIRDSYALCKHIVFVCRDQKEQDTVYYRPDPCLPCNPGLRCREVHFKSMKEVKSSSRPVIIPCSCYFEDDPDSIFTTNLLYKPENVKTDEIVQKLVMLCHSFIKKGLGIDLPIVTYYVTPFDRNGGIIQLVPNSKTLHEVRRQHTLQNHILHNNPCMTVHQIRSSIVKSFTIYGVLAYILDLGDRHLENIMVTNDGLLFHIDYSFLLGANPIQRTATQNKTMKITPGIVEAMGGAESEYYEQFCYLSAQIYNCFRRHSRAFYVLLVPLVVSTDGEEAVLSKTPRQLIDHLDEKFMTGQTYEEGRDRIFNHIEDERNYYRFDSLFDIMHTITSRTRNYMFG